MDDAHNLDLQGSESLYMTKHSVIESRFGADHMLAHTVDVDQIVSMNNGGICYIQAEHQPEESNRVQGCLCSASGIIAAPANPRERTNQTSAGEHAVCRPRG